MLLQPDRAAAAECTAGCSSWRSMQWDSWNACRRMQAAGCCSSSSAPICPHALQGAILGRNKVGLKFNCPTNKLAEVSPGGPVFSNRHLEGRGGRQGA